MLRLYQRLVLGAQPLAHGPGSGLLQFHPECQSGQPDCFCGYADDTEIEFPLRLTSVYIGTHGAIVSISIDETAPGLTVVGNVVTAPSGGSNYTWTIDGTSADSAQVSGNTYTVSVDYTTDYDIAVEYKDSTGSWQNARTTVRVTASN